MVKRDGRPCMQNLHLGSWDLAHQNEEDERIVARAELLRPGQVMLTTRELATMGGWVMGEASSSGILS